VKKTKTLRKITLSKETLAHLESASPELHQAWGGDNTGPSCEIFKFCSVAGLGC
jgi:hypothetical protein